MDYTIRTLQMKGGKLKELKANLTESIHLCPVTVTTISFNDQSATPTTFSNTTSYSLNKLFEVMSTIDTFINDTEQAIRRANLEFGITEKIAQRKALAARINLIELILGKFKISETHDHLANGAVKTTKITHDPNVSKSDLTDEKLQLAFQMETLQEEINFLNSNKVSVPYDDLSYQDLQRTVNTISAAFKAYQPTSRW